jgi:serine/threonine protein kinase
MPCRFTDCKCSHTYTVLSKRPDPFAECPLCRHDPGLHQDAPAAAEWCSECCQYVYNLAKHSAFLHTEFRFTDEHGDLLVLRRVSIISNSVQSIISSVIVKSPHPSPFVQKVVVVKNPLRNDESEVMKMLKGVVGVIPLLALGYPDADSFCTAAVFPLLTSLTSYCWRRKVTQSETNRWASSLVSALNEIHCRGIVHADISPSNILIDASGDVFISDFGSAVILSDLKSRASRFRGTRPFASLGLLRGDTPRPSHDFESLCYTPFSSCRAWETLTWIVGASILISIPPWNR